MRRLVVTAVLFLATACGGGTAGDSSSEPPAENAAPSMPAACTEVWQDGATLAADYDGCTRPDGNLEAAVTIDCDSGTGVFVTYDDRFFALLGQEITEADSNSPAYSKAYEDCFAG